MKSFKVALVVVVAIIATALVAFGATKLAAKLADNGGKTVASCSGQHKTYKLDIKNDNFSPAYIDAKRCDRLEILNEDDKGRLMAFGNHEHHLAYDGIAERFLTKDKSFSVTLDKAGDFLIHDHNDEAVQAQFSVR